MELDRFAGEKRKIIIGLTSFLYNEKGFFPRPVIRLVDFCKERKLLLILRCNINSYYGISDRMDTNERDRRLLEFLMARNLDC